MSDSVALRPIHYASVSGGKDSLYMMKVILENPRKYPLDLVFHMELEIDRDFVAKSVGCIKKMCEYMHIPFRSIKPRKSWNELFEKYGLPGRRYRWCNNVYKLDAKKQLHDWIREQHCRPVAYIGFCADEVKRFKYKVGEWNPEEDQDVCYPLAEEGIEERTILKWARTQSVFDGWYDIFYRQGCWLCPNATRLELAHLLKYSPEKYEFFIEKVKEYESNFGKEYFGRSSAECVDFNVKNKWLQILNEMENPKQQELFNE